MKRALLLLIFAACGGSEPARQCSATFTGNFTDATSTLANCPRLSRDASGTGWLFHFKVASPAGKTTDEGTIELGPNAAPTSLSEGTGTSWSTSATREPGCVYSASNEAVPTGSFNLTLTTVDTGKGEATGKLELRQYVHAQPMTDCGAGDEEVLTLEF